MNARELPSDGDHSAIASARVLHRLPDSIPQLQTRSDLPRPTERITIEIPGIADAGKRIGELSEAVKGFPGMASSQVGAMIDQRVDVAKASFNIGILSGCCAGLLVGYIAARLFRKES